jgi:hypothetical protein
MESENSSGTQADEAAQLPSSIPVEYMSTCDDSNVSLEINSNVVDDVYTDGGFHQIDGGAEGSTVEVMDDADGSRTRTSSSYSVDVIGHSDDVGNLDDARSDATDEAADSVLSQPPLWWGAAMPASNPQDQLAALMCMEQERMQTLNAALAAASAGRIAPRAALDGWAGVSGAAWRRVDEAEAALARREEMIRRLRAEAAELRRVLACAWLLGKQAGGATDSRSNII